MKARLPQGYGGGAPSNMNQMIRQAQKMQEDMASVQEELEQKEYETAAGGGVVKVKINGKKEILNVTISPDVVDPDDIETLQDLVTAAVNEAIKTVEAESAKAMQSVTGGMNLPGVF